LASFPSVTPPALKMTGVGGKAKDLPYRCLLDIIIY
jgi:hypothetical protein